VYVNVELVMPINHPKKGNSRIHTHTHMCVYRAAPPTRIQAHKTNKLNSQGAKKKEEGRKSRAEIVNNIHDVVGRVLHMDV